MSLPEPRMPDQMTAGQLANAVRDAVEAASNSRQLEMATALLQAQQMMQAAQQPCQHHHAAPARDFNAKKWIVIGGVGCVCALAFALASIAIAIGATCATACLLVLRSMWRQYVSDKH